MEGTGLESLGDSAELCGEVHGFSRRRWMMLVEKVVVVVVVIVISGVDQTGIRVKITAPITLQYTYIHVPSTLVLPRSQRFRDLRRNG